jgi:pantoate--beta-alanine ligase
MEIIKTPEAMQQRALELKKAGRVIGFVPTMGDLHEGHLSLIRRVRERCDTLVVSIFVNPAQFGSDEDLATYPRDLKRDESLCLQEGVSTVFYPDVSAMYADDASAWIVEESLSGGLCGTSRRGHFRGVCTVVAKLFNLVQPDFAVFGEKDAQQLRIIERMVRDLNFPVEIIRGPMVRESDGLAMSSRNRHLSGVQRQQALGLRDSLDLAERLFSSGEREVAKIRQEMTRHIEKMSEATIDYIEFVDDSTLLAVQRIEAPTLVALAVKIGSTRLIDNIILDV